ncbi:tetratricopeptide repeat protein [Paludisphaera rhizosphaerae]|uniref:tetratricopeptide repeat protein n=1 Tax=Paludisphaera rhizosphaerae TaxID=2711216 RepID=UPI0013EB5BEA|nr:tetratricopeptide repeat protein [Paludisphaera rhizosphaerae]
MQRKLNVRFLGFLIGLFVLSGVGVHTLHGHQLRRSAGGLLQQAAEAESENDLPKAVDHLERYLGIRPDDSDALARYALLREQLATTTANRKRLLPVLERAQIHNPGRSDLRLRIARIDIELGDLAAAREHLTVLPKTGETEQLLGECEEGIGHHEAAAAWYAKARGHAPAQIESYVRLANLLRRRLKDPDGADRIMDARADAGGLVATNPKSFRAYLERARYRQEYGLAGGDEDVRRAADLAPDEADVLFAGAERALARGEHEAARAAFDRLARLHPQDHRPYQGLADLELSAHKPDEAVRWLQKGIEALPGVADLRWRLAEVLVQTGRGDEAGRIVGRLAEEGYPVEMVDYLQARLDVGRNHWVEAARRLEEVVQRLATHEVLVPKDQRAFSRQVQLLLGRCYERIGDQERLYDAYRKALDLDPGTYDPLELTIRWSLAAALTSLDRIDEALTEYERILPRAPEARSIMARLAIVRNLRLAPEKRNWGDVDRLIDGLGTAPTIVAKGALLRAEVALARGEAARARELLVAAKESHPDEAELWTTLADLTGRQNRPDEALELLDEARRRFGDTVEIRLATARSWALRSGPEAREALARLADGVDRFGEEAGTLLAGLASVHLQAGDTAAARRLWTEVARRRSYDLGSRLILFDLATRDRDAAAMGGLIDELRRIEGDGGVHWRLAEALRLIALVETHQDEAESTLRARTLLAEVAVVRPNWSGAALAQARLDELRGDADLAAKGYLKAIELGDRRPDSIRRAVQLLMSRQRYVEAAQLLQQAQGQTPLSGDLQRLAADVALRGHEDRRALDMARKVVAEGSKDYRDYLWLGQTVEAIGRRAAAEGRADEAKARMTEAERALRRAAALAPEVPEPRVALVQLLVADRRRDEAEAAIREVQSKLAASAPLALGWCYETVGRPDQAFETYQAALAARPKDPTTIQGLASYYLRTGRPAEAEKHLENLVQLGERAPEQSGWARRTLAILLAAGGTHRQAIQALELLGAESGTASGPAVDADLRARARVLALQPSRARRREAIALLEQLGRRATPDDQFLLAQLAEADGDWPKARERLHGLLDADGQNPQYLALLVGGLLRHGHVEEAQAWFQHLETAQPRAPETIEMRARILEARGRRDDAEKVLLDFAREDEVRAEPVAVLLERLHHPAAAENLYRTAASRRRPEAVLRLATFLARQGRVDEALDICDQAWGAFSSDKVAVTSVEVLTTAVASEPQCQRVADRIARALDKAPESATLRFSLANVRTLQGNYQEAEMLYLRIFEQDRTNGTPLNNLAWLLATLGVRGPEALKLAERAIELNGPRPDLIDTRGVAHLAMGHADLAARDLQDAVAVTPAPDKYFHLARAYLMAKKIDEARAALREAVDLGLQEGSLHPLERPALRTLTAALARH